MGSVKHRFARISLGTFVDMTSRLIVFVGTHVVRKGRLYAWYGCRS